MSKYDLSIALIVKNEMNFLPRCVETLQPLRDALSCQLIITDTGSTDGTKEFAQTHADVYLEFDWCDDFSKARNTGVDAAEGRWFFFLDADNHMDDSLLEIAHFLKQPKVDRDYDAASILIRSYTDTRENLNAYFDFPQSALVNFTQGKRYFRDAVHESIPVNLAKFTHVPTMLHHWGYLAEFNVSKENRNIPLMKNMMEQDPENYKARIQFARELKNVEEKASFLEESVAFMAPRAPSCHETQMWLMGLRTEYHHLVIGTQNWALGDELIGQWEHYLPNTVVELQFLGFCTLSYLAQKREKDLFQVFPAYQTAFLQDQAHHDPRYDMLGTFPYGKAENYYKMELQVLHFALTTGAVELGTSWLLASAGYRFCGDSKVHPYLFAFFDFMISFQAYDALLDLYDFVQSQSTPEEKNKLDQKLTQDFCAMSTKEQQALLSQGKERAIYRQIASLVAPNPEVSAVVDKLKDTLLLLLQTNQLEEGKKLFLSLEKIAPHDPSIPPLKQLFFP